MDIELEDNKQFISNTRKVYQVNADSGLTCLEGDNLPVPRDCTGVQQCGSHEYCSLEQYITPNGFIRHKAACKDSNTCGGGTVPGTYMVICSECCDTDLCSASGCHSSGYNSTRGPICYHCNYPLDDISHCDRIKICSADHVCAVSRTPNGQYNVGCMSKPTCNAVKSTGVCSTCCTTDLCNRNCTRSSQAVTTPAPCGDSKDCQTISTALIATGGDVCQNPTLKYFCNSTCGICPGQTTRGTPVTPASSKPTTAVTTQPLTTAHNYCSPNPCLHGTCISTANNFVCVCNPGYTGKTCDTTDTCYANPCVHGTCVAIPGSFHCTCHTNFTGRLCDTAIVHDPCSPNPCVHGTCTASGQAYTCACNSGYSGPTCAVQDPCFPNPCVHGTCTQIGVTFSCSCNTGYTGATCSTVQNPCLPNPCVHGSCTAAGTTSYTCKCNSGYIGQTCNRRDPCSSVPCIHGKCTTTSSGGYHCDCQAGYTGAACDTDIDECQSNPCVHGACQDNINGYKCSCFQGYSDQHCSTDIDDCKPNPCVHGTCHDQVNGFQCTCSSAYTGTLCDKLAKMRDCKDVLDSGNAHGDGVYGIELSGQSVRINCDMTTAGGGWTILMDRQNGNQDFQHKDSTDYAVGFGHRHHQNFWEGLEHMHDLTSDGRRYQLRIDLVAANGTHYYEVYDDFSIGPAKDFRLHIGAHRGTAGDSLSGHNKFAFTTTDRDRDSNPGTNCANYLNGAWWFHDCYDSCLTCPYVSATPGTSECSSMSWNSIRYCEPLKSAKMMVRPM